jgi:YidC/Oxa1 family membrane protein insertase
MKNNKNFLLFFTASFLLFAAWIQIRESLWPAPKKKPEVTEPFVEKPPIKLNDNTKDNDNGLSLAPFKERGNFVTLGSEDSSSGFHLGITFDSFGACVRKVVLNKFQQADNLGRPVWINQIEKKPKSLDLIPLESRWHAGANYLYHFDFKDQFGDQPMDLLGKTDWKIVSGPTEEVDSRGIAFQKLVFETKLQNILISKTFTLSKNDYHVGMELVFSTDDMAVIPFRYQVTGPRSLPVEGDWYTNIFRNALIAQVDDRNNVYRDLQDGRQIASWMGGSEVLVNNQLNHWFRYAGVAIQYFSSMVVVDEDQPDQKIIEKVRPTLDATFARGIISKIDPVNRSLNLRVDGKDETFWFDSKESFEKMESQFGLGRQIAIYYRHIATPDKKPMYAVIDVRKETQAQPLFDNDITVRLTSKQFNLVAGKPVTHKYLLYNGPVKTSLLGDFSNNAMVNSEQVSRYTNKLGLNTMTDYQSPGWIGSFCASIFWTDIVIKCTNMMHWILWKVYLILPNFGLCIIFLTILIRGLMFPLSRKQAIMSIKMQELAPELKKMQEKLKGDKQAIGLAQMELYRKYNVNPFGTCWVVLIQMPVFMGLYFALQESIHFRLATFWPTWIINLAAPDMLINWGAAIPLISNPEDYGGFFYLGPYFNLLPIFAIGLMVLQQKMFTPPPTDEQQEAQQKMMTYMMVFMGFMFYKVAAGLCIYFIASSLWGLAERKLLPKSKTGPQPLLASANGADISKLDSNNNGKSAKNLRKELANKALEKSNTEKTALDRWRDWFNDILKQAEKK